METVGVIAAAIVGIVVAGAVLWFSVPRLFVGILAVWPFAIVAVLVGGFMGGGAGAFVAALVSGVVGWLIARNRY